VYELFSSPKFFIKFMLYDFVEHEGQNLISIVWNNSQKVGEMLSWSLRNLRCSFRITGPSAVDDLLLGADRGGTVITLDIRERREFSSCSIRFLYADLTFLIASLISNHS